MKFELTRIVGEKREILVAEDVTILEFQEMASRLGFLTVDLGKINVGIDCEPLKEEIKKSFFSGHPEQWEPERPIVFGPDILHPFSFLEKVVLKSALRWFRKRGPFPSFKPLFIYSGCDVPPPLPIWAAPNPS